MKRKPNETSLKDLIFLKDEIILSTNNYFRDGIEYEFKRAERGDISYPRLFRWVYFIVLNGYSSFRTMDELYEEIEKKRYYEKNPNDGGYQYFFNTNYDECKISDKHENKILYPTDE